MKLFLLIVVVAVLLQDCFSAPYLEERRHHDREGGKGKGKGGSSREGSTEGEGHHEGNDIMREIAKFCDEEPKTGKGPVHPTEVQAVLEDTKIFAGKADEAMKKVDFTANDPHIASYFHEAYKHGACIARDLSNIFYRIQHHGAHGFGPSKSSCMHLLNAAIKIWTAHIAEHPKDVPKSTWVPVFMQYVDELEGARLEDAKCVKKEIEYLAAHIDDMENVGEHFDVINMGTAIAEYVFRFFALTVDAHRIMMVNQILIENGVFNVPSKRDMFGGPGSRGGKGGKGDDREGKGPRPESIGEGPMSQESTESGSQEGKGKGSRESQGKGSSEERGNGTRPESGKEEMERLVGEFIQKVAKFQAKSGQLGIQNKLRRALTGMPQDRPAKGSSEKDKGPHPDSLGDDSMSNSLEDEEDLLEALLGKGKGSSSSEEEPATGQEGMGNELPRALTGMGPMRPAKGSTEKGKGPHSESLEDDSMLNSMESEEPSLEELFGKGKGKSGPSAEEKPDQAKLKRALEKFLADFAK